MTKILIEIWNANIQVLLFWDAIALKLQQLHLDFFRNAVTVHGKKISEEHKLIGVSAP